MTKLYGVGAFLGGAALFLFAGMCVFAYLKDEYGGKIKHGRPAGLSDEADFDEY